MSGLCIVGSEKWNISRSVIWKTNKTILEGLEGWARCPWLWFITFLSFINILRLSGQQHVVTTPSRPQSILSTSFTIMFPVFHMYCSQYFLEGVLLPLCPRPSVLRGWGGRKSPFLVRLQHGHGVTGLCVC